MLSEPCVLRLLYERLKQESGGSLHTLANCKQQNVSEQSSDAMTQLSCSVFATTIIPLCWCLVFFLLQPLTVTAPSLTIAENMADLIDGYCRLVNGATQSFIIRPQKGKELFRSGSYYSCIY